MKVVKRANDRHDEPSDSERWNHHHQACGSPWGVGSRVQTFDIRRHYYQPFICPVSRLLFQLAMILSERILYSSGQHCEKCGADKRGRERREAAD